MAAGGGRGPATGTGGAPSLLGTFTGHTDYVRGVCWAGGDRIVSASRDGSLKLWSVSEQRLLGTFEGHEGMVNCVCWLGGRRIASGSRDTTVKIWDTETRACLQTLTGHRDWVTSVCVLGDGRLVSGSADRTVKVWSVATGACLGTCKGHTNWVRSVAGLEDGRLVSASGDKTLKLWDAATQACLGTFTGHTGTVNDIVSVGGGRIVSASFDGTLRLWAVDTQACLGTFSGHADSVYGAAVLDSDNIISCGQDKTLRVWDVNTQVCCGTYPTDHTATIPRVAVLPDGRVVTASHDKTLKLFDVGYKPSSGQTHAAVAPASSKRKMSADEERPRQHRRIGDLGQQPTVSAREDAYFRIGDHFKAQFQGSEQLCHAQIVGFNADSESSILLPVISLEPDLLPLLNAVVQCASVQAPTAGEETGTVLSAVNAAVHSLLRLRASLMEAPSDVEARCANMGRAIDDLHEQHTAQLQRVPKLLLAADAVQAAHDILAAPANLENAQAVFNSAQEAVVAAAQVNLQSVTEAVMQREAARDALVAARNAHSLAKRRELLTSALNALQQASDDAAHDSASTVTAESAHPARLSGLLSDAYFSMHFTWESMFALQQQVTAMQSHLAAAAPFIRSQLVDASDALDDEDDSEGTVGDWRGQVQACLQHIQCSQALVPQFLAARAQVRLKKSERDGLVAKIDDLMLINSTSPDLARLRRDLERCESELQELEQGFGVVTEQLQATQEILREFERLGLPEARMGLPGTLGAESQAHALLRSAGVLVAHKLDAYRIMHSLQVNFHTIFQAQIGSRLVALKRFNLDAVREIRKELMVACTVRHPNVLSVNAAFVDGSFVYLEYDWMAGGSVDAWLKAVSRPSPLSVFQIVHGLVRGVCELHGHLIAHGDIKPGNILLDNSRGSLAVKLSDFGLARQTDAHATTLIGVGTLAYNAPERALGTTLATDMFALGKTVLEILHSLPTATLSPSDRSIVDAVRSLAQESTSPTPASRPTIEQWQQSPAIQHLSAAAEAGLIGLVARASGAAWFARSNDGVEQWEPYPPQVNDALEVAYLQRMDSAVGIDEGKAAESQRNCVQIRLDSDLRMVSLRTMLETRVSAAGAEVSRPVCRETTVDYPFPPDWPRHAHNVSVVELEAKSPEFSRVAGAFLRTVPRHTVVKISRYVAALCTASIRNGVRDRIQNKYLWRRYQHEKALMSNRLGGDGASNEKLLFHGTRLADPKCIYESYEGFDFRLSRGLYFGHGLYFAQDAAYSDAGYAYDMGSGTFCMITATVLCGRAVDFGHRNQANDRTINGGEPMRRPPGMAGSAELYDSVQGGPYPGDRCPSVMHVVYSQTQAYPQYLIVYRRG